MAADYLVLSRHGIFYFRRCVPSSLRGAIGRRQISFSLHTTNRREARLRVRACAAASDTFFSRVLAMAKKKKKGREALVTTYLTLSAGFDDNGNAYFNVDAEPDELDAAKELIASAGEAIATVKATASGGAMLASAKQLGALSMPAAPSLEQAIAAFASGHQVKLRDGLTCKCWIRRGCERCHRSAA